MVPLVLDTPIRAAEVADRLGRVAAPPDSGEGRHAGIVPAAHVALLHQREQLALAHHRVGEVEPVELDLLRMIDAQLLDVPVVQRPVILELQRADGVGDALDGIGLAVGVVVHRVDAPLVAGAVVLGVEDAVHHRVAHVQVGRGHVDLGPQGPGAVRELAGAHALEQVQVLLDRAVAIGALPAGFGQRAPVLPNLVRGQIADVGLAGLDQLDGPLVQLVEVVGGVEEPVLPIEAEPADVLHDRLDVLGLFLARIGVVEPQVALPAELGRQAEVEADGLGVADVQVAVRLGRKARMHAPAVLVGLQVLE